MWGIRVCYVCFNIYTNKCNMQHLNNSFNKFKMNDLTFVKMLIIQRNMKKLIKTFKYNCKGLSCICFNIF